MGQRSEACELTRLSGKPYSISVVEFITIPAKLLETLDTPTHVRPRGAVLLTGDSGPMPNMTVVDKPNTEDFAPMMMEMERLRREHDELKARLGELKNRVYLSPVEEVERKNLQKLKLAKKDRIATLTSIQVGNS